MKIFKSVVNDKELMIRPSGKPDYMVLGIRDSHLHGRVEMIGISREDIPSITFAMAESVEWSEEVKTDRLNPEALKAASEAIRAGDYHGVPDDEIEDMVAYLAVSAYLQRSGRGLELQDYRN